MEESARGPIIREPNARSMGPIVPPADWRGESVIFEVLRVGEVRVVVTVDGIPSGFEGDHFSRGNPFRNEVGYEWLSSKCENGNFRNDFK